MIKHFPIRFIFILNLLFSTSHLILKFFNYFHHLFAISFNLYYFQKYFNFNLFIDLLFK